VKIENGLLLWCPLTLIVLEKGPRNESVVVAVYSLYMPAGYKRVILGYSAHASPLLRRRYVGSLICSHAFSFVGSVDGDKNVDGVQVSVKCCERVSIKLHCARCQCHLI